MRAVETLQTVVNAHSLPCIMGVDPGATGALALIGMGAGYAFLDCADMPSRDRGKTTVINALDGRGLAKIVRAWRPTIAVLENAQPMPDFGREGADVCPSCKRDRHAMPPKQAFTFGGFVEGVRAVLEALDVDVVLVQPVSWKRAAGLSNKGLTRSQAKAQSLVLARELWPDAPLTLARHDGRAEALLMARFGFTSQMRFF